VPDEADAGAPPRLPRLEEVALDAGLEGRLDLVQQEHRRDRLDEELDDARRFRQIRTMSLEIWKG
jgi:hypothetical protein